MHRKTHLNTQKPISHQAEQLDADLECETAATDRMAILAHDLRTSNQSIKVK